MSISERRRGVGPEPMFNAPGVVIVLAVALIAIYALFSRAGFVVQDLVLRDLAFVPGRLTVWMSPNRAIDLLRRAQEGGDALAQAQAMSDVQAMSDLQILGGGLKPWTLLTYAFLHGSWTHVLLNTVWLIAFGPPVARRTMSVNFLAFMGVTAVLSALAQWAATPMEFGPLIGASGSISALMGAVTRFMFQPGAPLGPAIGPGRVEIEDAPVAGLGEVFTDPRTLFFLGIWFVTNFIFGAFGRTLGLTDAPVAWIAHVGGFVAGLLLFPLFDRAARR